MRHATASSLVVALLTLACSDPDPITAPPADAPLDVVASTFTLSVGGLGLGTGVVTSTPAGIDCSTIDFTQTGTCSAAFAEGATVTLTQQPTNESTFDGWGGACTGIGECVVAMSADQQVTASYTGMRYTVTILASGNGRGVHNVHDPMSDPQGMYCIVSDGSTSGTCRKQFFAGRTIFFLADPVQHTDYDRFVGFSGDCVSTNVCSITLTRDVTVTAKWIAPSIRIEGKGRGTVAADKGDIACTIANRKVLGVCNDTYHDEEFVTYTATPAAGQSFAGWEGACSGVAPCVLLMTDPDRVVRLRAVFTSARRKGGKS